MDSLVNQIDNLDLIDIDVYPHTETHIRDYVSKTWILKGDSSNDFQQLNFSLGKWSIKPIHERYYQTVTNITLFLNQNKEKFENYKKHCLFLSDLMDNIRRELKCNSTFNNFSFCGWNYFEHLTIRINKYDLEKNVIIFDGKESVMNADKLLKFVIKNKKKIAIAIDQKSETVSRTVIKDSAPVLVPLSFEERHRKMLRANSTPYKNHQNCMFLKRPLEKRFKVQACKTLVNKSKDPEYLAFVLGNFTI
jgi:hypothetical protein